MFDRMLGEQSPSQTGMDQFVAQRTPPQRPFALPFVEAVMQTEDRSDGIGVGTGPTGVTHTSGNPMFIPTPLLEAGSIASPSPGGSRCR